jgi:SAM-dependent methyltransferase
MVKGHKVDGPIKLHLGSGPRVKEGFINVDKLPFENVDVVLDLATFPWPWEDNSVDEILMEHTFEHFEQMTRVKVINEIHRVLKVGGTAVVCTPIFSSSRAYGDYTHQWPPVGEWTFCYWSKDWRLREAIHTDSSVDPNGFNCDFTCVWGYTAHEMLNNRSLEFQKDALAFWKEAAQDIICTATKRAPADPVQKFKDL